MLQDRIIALLIEMLSSEDYLDQLQGARTLSRFAHYGEQCGLAWKSTLHF